MERHSRSGALAHALGVVLALGLSACSAEGPSPRASSSDAGLLGISVDGTALVLVGGSWGYSVGNGTTSVIVDCSPAPGAVVTIGGETASGLTLEGLVVGSNSFTLVVTAEDGTTSMNHLLVIAREPPVLPTLMSLLGPGDALGEVEALPLFTWTPSVGARYWRIHIGDGALPPGLPASDLLSSPSWTPVAPLAAGTTYAWKVIPYDSDGNALASSDTRTFTTGTPPQAPADFAVVQAASPIHLALSWSPVAHADRYVIHRNGATTPVAILSDGATTSWLDACPTSGLNKYTIVASNSFGDSAASSASGTPAASGSGIVIIK